MAATVGTTLKERKEKERQLELRIAHALSVRKKVLEKARLEKRQKKKSVGELLSLVNMCGVEGAALQPAYTYVPKSYNLDRQITGLLNHMFVRYPVPAFLFQAFDKKSDDPFDGWHEMYRQWFVSLAQGGRFSQLVKGFMTSKEAFVFLNAPATNRIHENVWWAKMKVAGVQNGVIEKLMERIFSHYFFDDPHGRLAETILFYSRFHAGMDKVTFGEITDFLAWKLRNDGAFSLKGRTLTSVIKLTNEWHVLMQKARLGHSVEWKGMGIPEWEFEARDKIWMVTELLNNKELLNEGRKQKHCVYSYVQACMQGRSAIFSMRAYRKVPAGYLEDGTIIWDRSFELTRITAEVNSHRMVVQVRGLLNRQPTDEEKTALRHWTGEKGLVLRG
jgi:hypothetical protein